MDNLSALGFLNIRNCQLDELVISISCAGAYIYNNIVKVTSGTIGIICNAVITITENASRYITISNSTPVLNISNNYTGDIDFYNSTINNSIISNNIISNNVDFKTSSTSKVILTGNKFSDILNGSNNSVLAVSNWCNNNLKGPSHPMINNHSTGNAHP